MLSILFLLMGTLGNLSAAKPSPEEYYAFEMHKGVRTLVRHLIAGDMPKQHKGALVDRKDLKKRIGGFFEDNPTPYCYTNDASVEVLREFYQKSDEEISRYRNAYIAAIEASFDNLSKLQSAGKVAKNLNCKNVFSAEERQGLQHFSFAIKSPGKDSYLQTIQCGDPWSSAILQMGLGAEFPAPTKENPVWGRAAARTVVANVVYDMTCEKTTEDRVAFVMQKYNHCFSVISIKFPWVMKKELLKKHAVPTKNGMQTGCLMLPTEGQLIFKYDLGLDHWSKLTRFCALVPTFGFVLDGLEHICKEEGGYDVGSFFNMLFGGPGKRRASDDLFLENLTKDMVTSLQEPPQEGCERFVFWHTYSTNDYGMGLLADERVELPTNDGKKKDVRLGVFFCSFKQASYYEQDQAGPGKNYLVFKNVRLNSAGRFLCGDKMEFFIVERRTS